MLDVALKDLRLLLRDPVALFWAMGFPLVFALFFGAVLRAGVDDTTAMKSVVLVDEDDSTRSADLRARLEADRHVRIELLPLDEARAAVRQGEAVAYVRIPSGFGESSPWEPMPLEMGVDPSRSAESALLEGVVSGATRRLMLSEAGAPVEDVRLIERRPVVPADEGPRSSYDIVLPAAVLWGLMGVAASFAIAMVTERTRGTLLRLRTAPLSQASLLGGKALACVVASLVDATVLLAVGYFVFGVEIDSVPGLIVALVATVTCFAGLTQMLSVVGRSEQAVAGAGWATLILMAMLGGGMVPLSLMPRWLATLSVVSPVKWGIVALEGAIWRGFTAAELLVPVSVLLGMGGASFGVGVLLMRRVEA